MLKQLFTSFIFAISSVAVAQQTPIPPAAAVVDQAAMLKSPQRVTQLLNKIYQAGGPQIAVLTVPTLTNDSLEGYSIRVVDQWQLGGKEEDDGVLLLIVKDSKKIRIEVGQGLEGSLTDLKSSDVIENTIKPEFRRGAFDQGVMAGIAQVVEITNPDLDTGVKRRALGNNNAQLIKLLIFLAFILLVIFNNSSRSNLPNGVGARHRWGGNNNDYWRGGGGGGFGSGGGFGGGGGGFSGGGSSGGW